jgi:type II secretory pathway component PulJ
VKRTRPSQSGFTILETLLAASLGAVLVLVALGIMGAMDRTQAAVQRRQEQVDALTRLHVVMEKIFGHLVMQNSTSVPVAGTTTTARSTAGPEVQKEGIRNGEKTLEPRARLLLEVDAGSKSNASLGAIGRGVRPQRMEVVLDKAPVPPGWGRQTTAEVILASQAAEEMRINMASVRGVFELRPDRFTPAGAASITAAPTEGGMTLWWRPLPSQPTGAKGDPYAMEPMEDPSAVPIISGLVQCQWLAFKTIMEDNKPKSREKLPELTATQFQDLPAYMEMMVRTAGGVTMNWMFEVSWTNGPETTEEAEQEVLDEQQNQQGGGRGGPDGQGGPGGPGGGSVPGDGRQRAVPMGDPVVTPGGTTGRPRGGRGGGDGGGGGGGGRGGRRGGRSGGP